MVCTVESDGKVVRTQNMTFNLQAQESAEFALESCELDPSKTTYVNFDVVDTDGGLLLPPGSVIATDQFLLNEDDRTFFPAADGICKVEETDSEIRIVSDKVDMVFSKKDKVVRHLSLDGKEFLEGDSGIRPNFWRAPNDNDYGNAMPARVSQWRNPVDYDKARFSVSVKDNAVSLRISYPLADDCRYDVTYSVWADGIVRVDADFTGGESAAAPVDVPRIGFRMKLPVSADEFAYYGRGPWENYIDRKSSARVGLWKSSALDEYVPYVRPQECGHHTDTKWIELNGFRVLTDDVFEFNLLRNTIEDFGGNSDVSPQIHVNDIVPRNFVEFCIDFCQSGVGGYDSWGAVPEPSRVLWSNQDYSFSFTIIAI